MLPAQSLILLSLCVFAAYAAPTKRRDLLHDIFEHHDNDSGNSNSGNSNFNFNSSPRQASASSIIPAITSAIAGSDGSVNVNFN